MAWEPAARRAPMASAPHRLLLLLLPLPVWGSTLLSRDLALRLQGFPRM